MRGWFSSHRNAAISVAALLLAAYLLALITSTFLGQSRLEQAFNEQLRLNLQKQTIALGYFLSERLDDMQGLARQSSVRAYFANKALGMSMQYGLRASLQAVRADLRDLLASKRLQQETVYQRLALLDRTGDVLVEAQAGESGDLPWLGISCGDRAKLQVKQAGGEFHLFVSAPVMFKGKAVGCLAGEIRAEVAWSQLITGGGEDQMRDLMLYERDRAQPIYRSAGAGTQIPAADLTRLLNAVDQTRLSIGEAVAIKQPVTGGQFMVIGVYNYARMQGLLASPWFSSALAGLALPVLLLIGFLIKLNNQNLVLITRVAESAQRRVELDSKNRQLQSEVAKRIEYEEELAYRANYDALTRLPNRNLALDRLSQVLKRARRKGGKVLLMFVDLDHFKRVNDILGHAAGDDLLVQAAIRLQGLFRQSDTVARLGGDEFIIICPDVDELDRGELLAQEILQLFRASFNVQGHEFYLSTSIGLAFYPLDGEVPEELLKNADLALYQAKERGRDQYHFYTDELNQEARQRARMDTLLRHAIDHREIYLHYQPIVDLRNGSVVAAEALLRWENPELGRVSPEVFINLAEESGFIHELGGWMLHQACKDAALWQGKRPMRLAVNISPRQLDSPGRLLDTVLQALKQSGLPPQQLEVEITEGALLIDRPEVSEVLMRLESMGVRLSLDDFGTGYSALSYLQRFSFDVLKIDRSFVKDILDNSQTAVLARAIVAMARALKLEVIAEGVENRAQAALLRRLSCDQAQGYLFSRPVEHAMLQEMLVNVDLDLSQQA